MAESRMLMVYCYDVADDRRRAQAAEVLQRRAVRVQQSVFEAVLDEAEAEALLSAAARELAPEDSLRMYGVGAYGRRRSRALGGAPLHEDGDFYLL